MEEKEQNFFSTIDKSIILELQKKGARHNIRLWRHIAESFIQMPPDTIDPEIMSALRHAINISYNSYMPDVRQYASCVFMELLSHGAHFRNWVFYPLFNLQKNMLIDPQSRLYDIVHPAFNDDRDFYLSLQKGKGHQLLKQAIDEQNTKHLNTLLNYGISPFKTFKTTLPHTRKHHTINYVEYALMCSNEEVRNIFIDRHFLENKDNKIRSLTRWVPISMEKHIHKKAQKYKGAFTYVERLLQERATFAQEEQTPTL